MIKNSNELRIYVDDTILNGEISSGLSFTNSLVDVTKGPTGSYTEKISGQKTATFNFDNLFTSFPEVLSVGSQHTIKFGPNRYTGWIGQGIIESIEISGGTDDAVKYSGTIALTGTLEDFIPIIEDFFLIQAENDDFILLEDGELLLISIQEN